MVWCERNAGRAYNMQYVPNDIFSAEVRQCTWKRKERGIRECPWAAGAAGPGFDSLRASTLTAFVDIIQWQQARRFCSHNFWSLCSVLVAWFGNKEGKQRLSCSLGALTVNGIFESVLKIKKALWAIMWTNKLIRMWEKSTCSSI